MIRLAGYGWKRVTALIATALIVAGCTGAPETPAAQTQTPEPPVAAEVPATPTLTDTSWVAMTILGKPASAAMSELSFASTQVNGNAGCNDFQGSVEIEGQNLQFGALATTRKMCTPPVNGQETVFLEALGLTHAWERKGDTLALLDQNSAVLMQLELQ